MVAQKIIPGAGLADLAALLSDEREVFVVCDAAVCKNGLFCTPVDAGGPVVGKNGPFCTRVDEALRRVLGERLKGWYVLEASEGAKDIGTVMEIERAMMEAGVSRGGLVLSVGGGITTDIGGFAASIYKRGIRFANVPTTLLAMVDAAIGGKTGVNLDGYKNMVGNMLFPSPLERELLPLRQGRRPSAFTPWPWN